MQHSSQLRQMLAEHGLSRIADAIEQLAMPSIRLVLTRCGGRRFFLSPLPDESAVGISKVGGDPDLPPDFEWPLWEEIPLSFVAQFNLADVAPFDVQKLLPSSGMLYFFYDVTMEVFRSGGEQVNWKVRHYDGDLSVLARTPAPSGLPEVVDPSSIKFQHELSVPNSQCIEMLKLAEDCALTEEEKERYWELVMQLYDASFLSLMGRTRQPHDHEARHRLLGCPDVNNDGRTEAVAETEDEYIKPKQWEQLDAEAQRQMQLRRSQKALNWRLLFQIDTDNEAGL